MLAPLVGAYGDARVSTDDLAPRVAGARLVRKPLLDERAANAALVANDALAERNVFLLSVGQRMRELGDVPGLAGEETDAARADVQSMYRSGFSGTSEPANPRQK